MRYLKMKFRCSRCPLIKLIRASLFLLFCICATSFSLKAQVALSDEAMILQKCVDLPALQSYYPLQLNSSFKPLVIMQHGISFPINIATTHSGNNLVFKSKPDIASEEAYFLFWEYQINGTEAHIDFIYQYNMNTITPMGQKIILELEKQASTWVIINTNIQTIQL